jgi:hypothetical protein
LQFALREFSRVATLPDDFIGRTFPVFGIEVLSELVLFTTAESIAMFALKSAVLLDPSRR